MSFLYRHHSGDTGTTSHATAASAFIDTFIDTFTRTVGQTPGAYRSATTLLSPASASVSPS
jgi:hypothetical protein